MSATADFTAIGEAFGVVGNGILRMFRDFGDGIQRGLKAQAEQRRRDLDEELDWLGEWGGRRG